MKNIFITFLLTLTFQIGYGQACGVYRIKYVIEIQSSSMQVLQIKVPSIPFLHGYIEKESERAFILAEVTNNKAALETVSQLTSELYDDANRYIKLYSKKREALPVIIILAENNERRELTLLLSWDQIEMNQVDDEQFGNLFEMKLKLELKD